MAAFDHLRRKGEEGGGRGGRGRRGRRGEEEGEEGGGGRGRKGGGGALTQVDVHRIWDVQVPQCERRARAGEGKRIVRHTYGHAHEG